jgi:hypothetical protein
MKSRDVGSMDNDEQLGILGPETKRSFANRLPVPLGAFGIGLLVGAGVALLLAPKSGSELRHNLRAKLHRNSKSPIPTGTEAIEAGASVDRQA